MRKRNKSIFVEPSFSTGTDLDDDSSTFQNLGHGSSMSKYKVSRLGRKLHISDDPRILLALPKDVPERIWAEVLQKEENDLICFDIREEILEAALRIGYEHYMEKQNTLFTVHCTALAWLKLIDWHFYRHDPGEDPTAYPPCYIPKRAESWTPDEMPEPSVKDSWSRSKLKVAEQCPEEPVPPCPSSDSVDLPEIEPIPEKYWFPGNINLRTDYITKDGVVKRHVMEEDPLRKRPNVELVGENSEWQFVEVESSEVTLSETVSKIEVTDSEVLQKVTDYPGEATSQTESRRSSLKVTTPVDGSLQGAGDSTVTRVDTKRRRSRQGKNNMLRSQLPPLVANSLSRVSIISDCRLRNLRMETQYEVSNEKLESPVIDTHFKRKIV